MDFLRLLGFPKKSKEYQFKATPKFSSSSYYSIYVKRPGNRTWKMCYDGEELNPIRKEAATNLINSWCDNPSKFEEFVKQSQQDQEDKVVIISQSSRRMDDALD